MENKYKNTGGLWKNKDSKGGEYFSGSFDVDGKSVRIKVFPNTFKKDGDRSPDYRIMLDDGAVPAPKMPVEKTTTTAKAKVKPQEVTEEDIPF